ncbi:MAG TPA: hypothetical protein VGE74_27770 [Gemmata sp.]
MTSPADDFRPIGLGDPGESRYRAFLDVPPVIGADGRAAVYSPLTARAAIVDRADFELLAACRTFAPLTTHAANGPVAPGFSHDPGGQVAARVAELAAAGLLVRDDHAYASLGARQLPAAVSVIGVPTRGRPDTLYRCLTDLTRACCDHFRSAEIVIADGSPEADTREANRRAVTRIQGGAEGCVHYAGLEERARFVAALVDAGADPAAARFAVMPDPEFPFAAGANRNLLALFAAGRCLLQLDDDTVSRTVPVPTLSPGLALTNSRDPTEFWFLPELPQFEPGLGSSADIAGIHETLLGRGPSDWAALAGAQPIDSDGANAALFLRLRTPGARVRVTTAGVAGDSGMGSTLAHVLCGGPSRERLHRSEDTYRRAVAGGGVIRAVTRPTVTGGSVCMGLNLGLDLRTPLAPFPPVLRNEDGVFAAVVGACCPGALVGHLPAAVWHLPPASRDAARSDPLGRAVEGVRAEHLFFSFVRACGPALPTGDERRNFRILGEGLVGLGSLPAAEFAALAREVGWEFARMRTAQLLGRLEEYGGEPDYWATDVRRLADEYRDLVTRAHFAAPVDLMWGGDPIAGTVRLQRAVGGYGHLLIHWHDLVAAAGELRSRGVTPAHPIGL